MNQVNEPLYDLSLDVMQPRNNEKILVGTGLFFKKLLNRAEGLQISGIDYSEKMVESARELNRTYISSEKLDITLGDSEDLPYADQYFDKVFCNMVIYFWDQPAAHPEEVHRVLKPRGLFYTGMRTRESMLVFPFVEHGFNLYEIGEWSQILGKHGFTRLEIQKRMDPKLDFKGTPLRLESCCIKARRN